jgi:hypothetical protein
MATDGDWTIVCLSTMARTTGTEPPYSSWSSTGIATYECDGDDARQQVDLLGCTHASVRERLVSIGRRAGGRTGKPRVVTSPPRPCPGGHRPACRVQYLNREEWRSSMQWGPGEEAPRLLR